MRVKGAKIKKTLPKMTDFDHFFSSDWRTRGRSSDGGMPLDAAISVKIEFQA